MSANLVDDRGLRELIDKAGHLGAVKVVAKASRHDAIIPNHKAALLKRMADMESELGRMTKLLGEMRADVAHLD